MTVLDYVTQNEYVGAEIEISNIDDYGYLTFYGKKVQDHGQPTVFVLSDTGELIGKAEANYRKIDNEWHQYVIDITKAKGSVKVFFNGGYIDQTGSVDSDYIFSNIVLY